MCCANLKFFGQFWAQVSWSTFELPYSIFESVASRPKSSKTHTTPGKQVNPPLVIKNSYTCWVTPTISTVALWTLPSVHIGLPLHHNHWPNLHNYLLLNLHTEGKVTPGGGTPTPCIQSPPKESIHFWRAEYSKLRGTRWKVGGAPNPSLSWSKLGQASSWNIKKWLHNNKNRVLVSPSFGISNRGLV